MAELRLINGGKGHPDDEAQLLFKWKQLRGIDRVLSAWRKGFMPPRATNVTGFGILATCLLFGLAYFATNHTGVRVDGLVQLAVSPAVGLAVAMYVAKNSNAPRSHVDHLDRLLAAYEPVSKDAFRWLQERVKERGALDSDLVDMWIERERDAIQIAAGWRMPSEARFLKKRV